MSYIELVVLKVSQWGELTVIDYDDSNGVSYFLNGSWDNRGREGLFVVAK